MSDAHQEDPDRIAPQPAGQAEPQAQAPDEAAAGPEDRVKKHGDRLQDAVDAATEPRSG